MMSPEPSSQSPQSTAAPHRQLTLFDSTSIIVGIIIGSSIYKSTPLIANQAPNVAWLVGIWVLGGVLSLIGALCYAELANLYPKEGGDYVYLSEAFGRKMGFVFAWVQFWIVRPGSVGTLAYVFADYANRLVPLKGQGQEPALYAVGSIVVLSGINLLGVRAGKWTQNLLTVVKFVGLIAIVVVGFCFAAPVPAAESALPALATAKTLPLNFGFAMILIFYAYSGWNEMAYVGSEVRDPRKNILRALVLGTVSVSVVYVALNLAFVHALGFDGLRHSDAVAADLLALSIGPPAARVISLLICISALGAINGMIFTGSRIFYAMGTEHRLFAWLGQWSSRSDTPARPIIIQAAVTVAIALGFGWTEKGFENSIAFTAPPFWLFLFLVGLALFALRERSASSSETFRVPLYPVLPIAFCLSSAYMIFQSLDWAVGHTPGGVIASAAVLLFGLGLSALEG